MYKADQATWERLALPRGEVAVLRQIADETKMRQTGRQPGFLGQARGPAGIVALFVGSSGPGKAMATGVFANDLRRNLYRVDLSTVRSKYIGETKKNLTQLFQEAKRSPGDSLLR
jgi:SpoVK/Ycf46/Vps4 family AAA+-type ATPase